MTDENKPKREKMHQQLEEYEKRAFPDDSHWEELHRYRCLFENMLDGYAYCKMLFENDRPHDFIYIDVNPAFERLTELKNVVGQKVSQLIPGIRESNPELFEIYGRVALTGKPERFETFMPALGIWFDVSVFSPAQEYFVAVFDNITERKHAQELLSSQSQICRMLAEAHGLNDTLQICLDTALRMTGMDHGGIYLLDRGSGALQLAIHAGLSPEFVKAVEFYVADTPHTSLVMQGNPVYTMHHNLHVPLPPEKLREGLKSLAVIPIRSDQGVIGSMNLASKSVKKLGPGQRAAMETIVSMMGNIILRAQVEEELVQHRDRLEELVTERTRELEDKTQILEELNAATRVLLRQREDDKKELEGRFVSNVKNLILPYAEKLKNTRLNEKQMSYLGIMTAHLNEIVSYLPKTLQQFNLTPTEIQVASLIKDGKTTKEIAEIMGIATSSVDTHRKSIRKKVGLSKQKINLQMHLYSLEK